MRPFRFVLLSISLLINIPFTPHAQWIREDKSINQYLWTHARQGANIIAGTEHGVFQSTDSGRSWNERNSGLKETDILVLAAQTNVTGSTSLFAGTWNGVYLSTDDGLSWTETNSGLISTAVLSLAVSGSNIFAGTYGGGVHLSTDNGTNWTPINIGLANDRVFALIISGPFLFAGTEGGVFKSKDNGASWTEVSTGLKNRKTRSLIAIDGNLFAGTMGGIFLSTDNGTNWREVNAGLMDIFVRSLAVIGSDIFLRTQDGAVWKRPLTEMITHVPFNNPPFHQNMFSKVDSSTYQVLWKPFNEKTMGLQGLTGIGVATTWALLTSGVIDVLSLTSEEAFPVGILLLVGGIPVVTTSIYLAGEWSNGNGSWIGTSLGGILCGALGMTAGSYYSSSGMTIIIRIVLLGVVGSIIGYHASASEVIQPTENLSYMSNSGHGILMKFQRYPLHERDYLVRVLSIRF